MTKLLLKQLLLLLIAVSAASCTTWKNKEITETYNPLISGYTGGEIISKQKIIINLSKELVLKDLDSSKIGDLVDIYPSVDYTVTILTSTTLNLTPKTAWKRGEKYRVKVNLDKIYHAKQEPFLFDVFIRKQAYSIVLSAYQPITIDNPKINNLYGAIHFLEPEEIADIKNGLEAEENGDKLKITWSNSSDKLSYEFVIQDVKRENSDQNVVIKFDGKLVGADKNEPAIYPIPNLSTFGVLSIVNAKVAGDPFKIVFSDALKANQNMDGMFSLGDGQECRVSVDKNIVSIYPLQELTSQTELTINESIANYNGKILGSTKVQLAPTSQNTAVNYVGATGSTTVQLSPVGEAPSVKFVSQGTIYPTGGEMIVPFTAKNLRAVTFRIVQIYENNIGNLLNENKLNRVNYIKRYGNIVLKKHIVLDDFVLEKNDKEIFYGLNISNFIKREPGALYMITLSFVKEFSTVRNSTAFNKEEFYKIIADTTLNEKETAYFSNSSLWESYSPDSEYNDEEYDYEEMDNPASDAWYRRSHSVTKMILVSDIGIVCNKLEDKTLNVVTSSISSTKPLKGVVIKAYSLQNQVVGTGTTDGDGVVNFVTSLKPAYLVANNNDERGYMQLTEDNKQITTSFNTTGVISENNLKGYLYGDRGVWRPDDTTHISFILQDANNTLPEGHPISIELFDTKGRLIEKQLFNKNESSIYTAHFHIPETGATGSWSAEAVVGGNKYYMPVRVETIKPNRLKIALDVENRLFNTEKDAIINLKGSWLSGVLGANLKFDATYTMSIIDNPFPEFNEYTFSSPFAKIENTESSLASGNLDAKGEYVIAQKFIVEPQWGLVRAKVKVRLYESGGDFSTDLFDTKISACSSYCGISVKQGSNNEIPIKLVTIDENGKKLNINSLSYSIYSVNYGFWYQGNSSTSADFISSNSHNIVQKGFVSTSQGEGVIKFKAPDDYWATYLVVVENSQNGNLVGKSFSVYEGNLYEGYDEPKNSDDAQFLNFKAKKTKYSVGEKASVNFPSVEDGKAIVTILKGGKIIKQEIVSTSGKSSDYDFEATANMVPNVYLSITTLQPFQNVKNDMPVRMYGLTNIFVEDPESKLLPQITAPAEIKPNSNVTIQVKEKNGTACYYTLAIVDEGLLDITRFKTPDPFTYFFQKEALTAETYDLYNYVLGGYYGGYEKVFGIGGDLGSMGAGKNQKANRFKPMVKFIGPFELDKNGMSTQTIAIPYYVGSVRIMVVAASQASYGAAETTMKIKNSFMVLSSLPRVLSPNDEIDLPVTILSAAKSPQTVKLAINTSSSFNSIDGLERSVLVNAGEEKTVVFKFKIGTKIGPAKFSVTAQSGNDALVENIDIEIRNPNNPASFSKQLTLEPNEEISYNIKNKDWDNFKASLELSTVKPLNLNNRLSYLIRYPHGCIEQTTSAAYPQLYLPQLVNLSNDRKVEIEQNVKRAISRLTLFQCSDGGLSYWPGEKYSDDWGTSYGGSFLLEAQRAGYLVPSTLLKKLVAYQSKQARSWSVDDMKTNQGSLMYSAENQAYRLYTLALANQPDLAAMNRLRTSSKCQVSAKWLLAGGYALMGQKEVANSMVNNLKNLPATSDSWRYNYGSEERDRAMMLNTLVLLDKTDDALDVANYLTTRLNSDAYMNTQATAVSLISMANFLASSNISKDINASVTQAAESKNIVTTRTIETMSITTASVKVKNNGSGKLFCTINESGLPISPITDGYSRNLRLEMKYLNSEGIPINLYEIKQGEDITIRATIKNEGVIDNYTNIALTQILPTGWEIRNLRLEGNENLASQNFTYQDIRDDRVFTYFNLNHGETKVITLFASANYKGVFYLPSVNCESMYDNNIAAQVVGQKVVVK